MKRELSLFLAFAMVLSLFLGIDFGISPVAKAATNESTTLDNNKEDVFAALGFDTTALPDGFDADTTSNPYGRDNLTANQVFEVLAATSGGTRLYGNNDNTVTPNSLGAYSTAGAAMPTVKLFSGAAGDFDGDGLAGEVAYVGIEKQYYGGATKEPLILYIYDSNTNTYSSAKTIGSISPYYTCSSNPAQMSNQTVMEAAWQNLLQITTGDFDGDGASEIAVYVAESGDARVDIYKYGEASDAAENAWLTIGNWTRVWSYAVSSSVNAVPNMVSLVSGDFNRDGVDDLGISYGRVVYNAIHTYSNLLTYSFTCNYTGKCLEYDASQARILWGGTSNMLQMSNALDLGTSSLGGLIRVSLTYGDADADGTKDLIMAGEPLSDRDANFLRSVGVYTYDESAGLMLTSSKTLKIIDAENMDFPVYDENGNPTGDTQTTTVSTNGYDLKNLSSQAMRCNTAVVTPDRSGYTYIYVDSTLCKYYQTSLSMAYELDDDTSCDGGSTETKLGWNGANSSAYSSNNVYNMMTSNTYCEYGAISGDINGAGNQILVTNYLAPSTIYNSGYDAAGTSDPYSIGIRGTYKGYSVLYTGGTSGVTCLNKPTVTGSQWTLASTAVALTMPDTDIDTTLIEYTGIHYLTYSDPKVLAVIAAAPYFKDVDIISDYDYAWQNTTSWASVNGEGYSDTVSVDFEVGGYLAFEATICNFATDIETSLGFTLEWEKETSTTTEYTLQFETSQDEDSVAFYCIPTECYVYNIYIPDGNGGYTETSDIISNTFSPCYQILSLDYYESIQGDYDALPQISGTAITSTPGDPSSYPASSGGYDVVAEWNSDPAGVSFGNGSITQEIAITKEESESYNFGSNLQFKMGFGNESWMDIGQSGAKMGGGVYFSLNPAGGFTTVDLSGTTISGTVTNMPVAFQDYGYYYNWKLFSYKYTFDDGTSVPVVSYVVGDVSEPPTLPADFKQDYARSTGDTNCLTWSSSGSASRFYIYKYGDYPEGSGLQLIATINAGDSAHYTLKQDANGNYYKEFYYNDKNLTPYTEYKYCIQVERASPVPPLSAPSAYLTARTKAVDGNPLITVYESDGTNDSSLLVYPDKNSYLTAGVTGPEGQLSSNYYSTVLYQWQKSENGAWTDLDNETSMTLTFASAGMSSAGTYRCRVNVLTKESATYITAYTHSLTVSHSKRSTHISAVWAHDASPTGVELYAKVVNDHADSATIPNGTVLFTLTSGSTGLTYQYAAEVDSTGVANGIIDDSLPEGVYSVYAYYSGSYVFKPSSAEASYLSDLGSGYAIDVPASVSYGDGGSLAFMRLAKSNGITTSTPQSAAGIELYQADTASLTSISGAVSVPISDTVVKGTNYKYSTEDGDIYFFTATRSGIVTMDGKYIYYSTEPLIGYITDSTSAGTYDIAENIPAGGYVLWMKADDGSAWASFTVKQREVTLQLPAKVGSEGAAQSDPTLGSLSIVSGSFASCDCTSSALNAALADTVVALTYTNTAGKRFSVSTVSNTCGYYIASRAISATLLNNYKLTFLDGSVSILGATHTLQVGARPFSGGDVGTVYVVSPDYAYTRSDLTYDSGTQTYTASVNLNYQAGTRVVLYAVADSGYEVYDWYVNGVAQGSTATSFPYVMYAENTRIEVQFAVKQSSLIFGTSGDGVGGTITCSDPTLSSGSIVLSNSKFTFTAAANEGYHFKEWRYTELGSGTAYDTEDSGMAASTFYFIMPVRSCTLYAVFERDSYTLTLNDSSGTNGLTAWYYASATDETANTKTWITGATASIKGDTQVTVQPATGFLLDDEYNYVSEGSQGTADYLSGTYAFKLQEDTVITATTKQQDYDVTVKFNVAGSTAQSADAVIDCTAGDQNLNFPYTSGLFSSTLSSVAGGSSVMVNGSCASYYTLDGWESSLNSPVTAVQTSGLTGSLAAWQSLAAAVSDGGAVTKGSIYKHSASGITYYFMATETGKILIDDSSPDIIHMIASGDGYGISKLGSDLTLTLYLTEKPVHRITLDSITDGVYSYSLPVGATDAATETGMQVITLHDGDDFPVTVTSVPGKTVTYWTVSYMPESTLLTAKYRATSLTYTLEEIHYNYTVTPVFAASTYNTITWPAISGSINGITLTPVNCLSSVASGSDFTFKLEGSDSALALIDKVYANGYEFTAAGNKQAGSTYSYNSTDHTYTITGITANQVITLTFHEIGLTVNGTDISAFSGTGWTYDAASQVLTVSSSSRILSGVNNQTYAPDLAIVLDSYAGSVTFDNLDLTSAAGGYLISSLRTTGVSVTVTGSNTLTENSSSTTSAILLYTANNLTVRGNGSLTMNLDRTKGSTATKGIYCKGEFFITGTVDMTVNVPMASDGGSGSYTNTVGIWCGKFTQGVADSLTSAPSLKVYMYDHNGTYLPANYCSIGILAADSSMTVWTGSLLICSNVGLYAPYHYIYNYGGSTEIYSLNGAIFNARYAYWTVNYSPAESAFDSGFLTCYGDSDTSFTTRTFGMNKSIQLDGYDFWESFLRDFFGLNTDDTSPLEAKYLLIAPATVSDPGITVHVTDPGPTADPSDDITTEGKVALSSGTGGDGTYYYYNVGGTLVEKAESDIHHADYKNEMTFYAKYNNGVLLLTEFTIGVSTNTESTTTLSTRDPFSSGVFATLVSGTEDFPVTKDEMYYYFYRDTDTGAMHYLYFTAAATGWLDPGFTFTDTDYPAYITINIPITLHETGTTDLSYTLSGVDDSLSIISSSASSLALAGLTAQSMKANNACKTFGLSGNNYLAGAAVKGLLTLNCDSLDIVSDGTGTLSVINAGTESTSCGIQIVPVTTDPSAFDLKLTNVKSLSTYGAAGGIKTSSGYTVRYYDDVLSNAYDVYGYGWLSDAGASSATATIQKGGLVGASYIDGFANNYVKYYCYTSAAGYMNALAYDKNADVPDTLGTVIYSPAVLGNNHLFDLNQGSCSLKLQSSSGSTIATLAAVTDFTWVPAASGDAIALGTLTLAAPGPENVIGSLSVGNYALVVSFFDDNIYDATTYTLQFPLTVKNTVASVNGITIAPENVILSRNGAKAFTTSFTGTTPKTYEWLLDGTVINGATASSYTLTVASDAALGDHILQVNAYESENDTDPMGTAAATITVAPHATGAVISCATETPSGDGSYTLYHNSLSTWNFTALVSLDNGGDPVSDVTWSLWGAKMRSTSVNSLTGSLTISTNETGTGGMLKITATYDNADGTSFAKTAVIYLSTDASVSYSNVGASNGAITSLIYGEAQNKIPAEGAWIPSGSTVTASAAPDDEYTVAHWYINGQSVMDNAAYTVSSDGSSLTFTAGDMGKYIISADYINMYNFTISFSAGTNGSLTAAQNGVGLSSRTTVLKNTSVTFTAVPDTYYRVAGWIVDGVSYEQIEGTTFTGTSLTLSDITENHTVSVQFEGVPIDITFVAGINAEDTTAPNGTMSIFDDGTLANTSAVTGTDKSITYTANVNAMSEVNIFANPDPGYQVKCWYVWTDGGYAAVNSSAEVANYYMTAVTGALKVKVEFEAIPSYNVTVSVDSYENGGGTVASGIHSVSTSDSMVLSVKNHSNLTLLAAPDAGSYLYQWRITGAAYITNGNSVTITNITGDATVAAIFRKVFYNVSLASGSGGTMTADYALAGVDYFGTVTENSSASIKSGSTVTVSILPDTGNTVKSLTVNGVPTAYSVSYDPIGGYLYTYTISSLLANADISVSFKESTCYTLTAPADDYFSILTAGGDTEEAADDTYTIGGTAQAFVMSDGFSGDGATGAKAVDILSGGAAKLTFTPSSSDFSVDVHALRNAINAVLTKAGSHAVYRICLDGSTYAAEFTGIDAILDFSTMANPFVISPPAAVANTVTFGSTVHGTITAKYNGVSLVTGAKVPEGSEVVFTMIPDAHCRLTALTNGDDVLDDAVSSGSTYIYTAAVNGDVSVSADFAVAEYYVNILKLGTGTGVVTAAAERSITSSGYLPAGSQVLINATAAAGSSFNCMSVGSDTAAGSSYTVSSLDTDLTVTAVFDVVSKAVTYNAPANGKLRITDSAGNPIAYGESVPVGTVLVITAVPDAHYALKTLLAGGASVTGNTYTVDAGKTNNIEATFTTAEVLITWTNPDGGSIRVFDKDGADIANSSYVKTGSSILIRGIAKSLSYELTALTMNGTAITSGNLYTVPAIPVTVTAVFKYVGDAPGSTTIINNGGGGALEPEASLGEIDVVTTEGSLTALGTVTSTDTGSVVDINGESFAQLAEHAIATDSGIKTTTDFATITFDSTAIEFLNDIADSEDVVLEIEQQSATDLSAENRQVVGNHPVYQFTLTAGSVKINHFNGGKATINIPYTLQSGETPESVVVYYIDGDGVLQTVSGAYNTETKTVDFVVKHFSLYALGNNLVQFSDVEASSWYSKAVTFIAARGITNGVGNGEYGPERKITRGEFIVMLMRAYGIGPDVSPTDNFSDSGNTYYTNYLAAAKRLGISKGIGDNLFAPNAYISRQDMFTLLYRALETLGQLPENSGNASLSAFPDSTLISDYAQEAFESFVAAGIVSGSNGRLNPTGESTRAEMAQILYNLFSA